MKRILASLFLVLFVTIPGFTQGSREVIGQDPRKAGGTFYVYDYEHPADMSPAPDGYKPFYISHFARHGARYCNGEFNILYDCLSQAAEQNLLTEEGKSFYSRFIAFYEKVKLRKGNLTGIGQAQERAIASHMWERFPEVFEGPTHVEAASTESARVIMSMWACLSRLVALDADLDVSADASANHAVWLQPNLSSSPYYRAELFRARTEMREAAAAYFRETAPCEDIARRFFTSVSALEGALKTPAHEFAIALLSTISDTYCLDSDQGLFDDILSPEESYLIWKGEAARFALSLGPVQDSGCMAVDYAGFTLGEMIESALQDIEDGKTQLRLRFEHDGGIAPLIALMNINGCGEPITSFEQAGETFPNYNIPMGCSVQLIFFRNDIGTVLVKVLLNETEASLPFPAAIGPYYSWEDFLNYYLPIIREAQQALIQ